MRLHIIAGPLLALALHGASLFAQGGTRTGLLERALAAVSEPAIRAHLRFLAGDALEGRAPGTRGGLLSEMYIAAQFEASGLEPAGENGSYFQPVSLVGITPQPSLIVGTNRRTLALEYLTEFVAWPEMPEPTVTADGELVFVGYGVTAPEWGWDDYVGEPLAGRIALILVNDPGLSDSTRFNGRQLTYYGRWTYKLEQAARMGATGALLIHTTESATYPWSVVRNSWSGEQIMLARRSGPGLRFAGWMTLDAGRRVMAAAGRDLDLMVQRAQRANFRPMRTGVNLAIDIRSSVRRFQASNVVGLIRGRDSALADEGVVLVAHHDHKGVGSPLGGDSIYNGAQDNASGVAVLLAAASALGSAHLAPRRSLIFLATTAEESGLLGAESYVGNPSIPLERTLAAINLDGANLRGRTNDVPALGAERSTVGAVFMAAAAAESLTVSPDPNPAAGSFFRSDHFPFARAGVPVLSIRIGRRFVGKPPGWGAAEAERYIRERYHQPSDEFSPAFDLAGAVQQAKVMIRTAWALAQGTEFPTWNHDSEFRPAAERLRTLRGSR